MAPSTQTDQPMCIQGFERDELQKMVEAAGFGNITFSTAYEIKKKMVMKRRVFPVFLMAAQKI